MFIDFNALKERLSFEEVINKLELDLPFSNNQFRGQCPSCKGGDSRVLVITPGKGFYCNVAGLGGDVISLTAHVKQCSVKDAAKYLADCFPTDEAPKATPEGFDPEAYAEKLDCSAEALEAFGVSTTLIEKVGWMGVCKKGVNKGKLVFPLRGEFGEFIDFIGVENVSLPKKWRCE